MRVECESLSVLWQHQPVVMAIGKFHFKDRLGVLGIHQGPQEEVSGMGTLSLCLFLLFPHLPAGLWGTCCYLWAVGVSWKSSPRAALVRADKLLKALTSRAEKFMHAWISVEGLLLLAKSQAQLCRLWDPLEMPRRCPVVSALPQGGRSCKQGTGAGDPGHCPCPWELWAKGMPGLGAARVLQEVGQGQESFSQGAGRRMLPLQPVRIPLKCKECLLGLLYGSCSLIPQGWSCHGMHNGCLCPHTPTPQPGCFLDANTSPSFPSTPASVTVRD